jgi:hypothetical protein
VAFGINVKQPFTQDRIRRAQRIHEAIFSAADSAVFGDGTSSDDDSDDEDLFDNDVGSSEDEASLAPTRSLTPLASGPSNAPFPVGSLAPLAPAPSRAPSPVGSLAASTGTRGMKRSRDDSSKSKNSRNPQANITAAFSELTGVIRESVERRSDQDVLVLHIHPTVHVH